MKLNARTSIITATVTMLLLTTAPAPAALTTVGTDATWLLSTTVVPDVDLPDWVTNVVTPPPGLATYTSPVVVGGGVASGGAAALGVTGITTGSDITYYRQTFNLDPFSTVSATVALPVDNGAAVWINGSFVGAETTLSGTNWSAPYPSFDIATDGSIININKFDLTVPFTGFVAGANEVIIAVRNLGAGSGSGFPNDSGGFGFRMDITTEPAAATVPEPATAALGLLGLGALAMRRRRAA